MPESFIENYKAKHMHPLNKLTHSVGIPIIVVSLSLFLLNWRWALALFIFGWILQFVDTLSRVINPPSSTIPFTFLLVHGGWSVA
jgi:uncharacterized membrane protein YGL010W